MQYITLVRSLIAHVENDITQVPLPTVYFNKLGQSKHSLEEIFCVCFNSLTFSVDKLKFIVGLIISCLSVAFLGQIAVKERYFWNKVFIKEVNEKS